MLLPAGTAWVGSKSLQGKLGATYGWCGKGLTVNVLHLFFVGASIQFQ